MKEQNEIIDILFATYNGENYIEQQIESIINQTYENWNIIFRDDGSNDNTVNIIKEYTGRYPDKMKLVNSNKKGLGASGNFSELLEFSNADYSMFCDQDDVWMQDKIKVTLGKMKELERGESGKPILVHTDLMVVDTNLNMISKSMFEYQNLNSSLKSINYLLVQNNITGCTMMINRSLREKATPIPKDIIMHDWWLALVASSFGEIGFVNEATIFYRQHGKNDTGAKGYSMNYFIERIKSFNKMYKTVNKNFMQAKVFHKKFVECLDKETKIIVEAYINMMKNKNRFKRVLVMKKFRFYKQGKIRNMGLMFILTTLKNKK